MILTVFYKLMLEFT